MTTFSIYSNEMEGTIPDSLADWEELETFAIGYNHFSGDLPDIFSGMTKLYEVEAQNNELTGNFDLFEQNEALTTLMLQNNELTGTIGELAFINVPLEVLDLSNNQIGGQFPADFYDIGLVSLHNNQIKGSLPAPFPGYQHAIYHLSLYNNKMSGDLPDNLGDLVYLRHLDLSFNQFDGIIPESIGSCAGLQSLFLGDNDFLARDFPDLSDLTNLRELSLRNMKITGPIPDWLGTFLVNLVFLDLSNNQISGSLPVTLQKLGSLEFLLLSHNGLTGNIPTELWLAKLRLFGLDHNSLQGSIGELCGDNGPVDLDWLVTDDTVECSCCSDQCGGGDHSTCGGGTLLSPNLAFGYRRFQYIFNAELVFDASDVSDADDASQRAYDAYHTSDEDNDEYYEENDEYYEQNNYYDD